MNEAQDILGNILAARHITNELESIARDSSQTPLETASEIYLLASRLTGHAMKLKELALTWGREFNYLEDIEDMLKEE
jgi:hypothetical protein